MSKFLLLLAHHHTSLRMPTLFKRLIGAGLIVLVLIAMNAYMSEAGLFGFGVPPYFARVIMLAGINVILAVSLNLITGFTGQFSIGHAGFMAVGAYSSAYLTVYYAQGWERSLAGLLGASIAHALIFLLAILVGALVAAIAGLIVGIPSLRLRGDYLAIVTLGFAEIIRIVILNIDKVGGATGFTVPGYTNFLWVGACGATIVIVHNIVHSDMDALSFPSAKTNWRLRRWASTRRVTKYCVLCHQFHCLAGGVSPATTRSSEHQRFSVHPLFEIIIVIVLGGMGSLTDRFSGNRDYVAGSCQAGDFRLVVYSALLSSSC
jgi:branched-chain amino acid transport system permease protein